MSGLYVNNPVVCESISLSKQYVIQTGNITSPVTINSKQGIITTVDPPNNWRDKEHKIFVVNNTFARGNSGILLTCINNESYDRNTSFNANVGVRTNGSFEMVITNTGSDRSPQLPIEITFLII